MPLLASALKATTWGKELLINGNLQVAEQILGDCIAVKGFQGILVQEINASPVL